MRESIGGAFTLEIIIVFMVLVNSYLAFSVNYSKAFKVKNALIDLIENNEGYPAGLNGINCTNNNDQNTFSDRFCKVLNSYGYTKNNYATNDPECYNSIHAPLIDEYGVCIIPHTNIIGQNGGNDLYQGVYYTVYTYINIELPILKTFFEKMPGVFRISGDTNIIYSSGGDIFVGE